MTQMQDWAAGVDEAGRGPLAGPVVAAAVILDPSMPIDGLQDSKKLSAARREELFVLIQQRALAWAVGEASVAEIDQLNILHATMLAMQRAVEGLLVPAAGGRLARVLVDGNRCPSLAYPAQAIVRGDASVPAISAASILAKVTRDRLMQDLHQRYPQYEFDRHKGYPTVRHRQLLMYHGPCPDHRRSFAPVAEAVAAIPA